MTDTGPAEVTGALLARKGTASPAGFKGPPAQPLHTVAHAPKRPGSRKLLLWIVPTAIVAVGATLAARSILTPGQKAVAIATPLKIKPAKIKTPVRHEPASVSSTIDATEPRGRKQLATLEIVPPDVPMAEPVPPPPALRTALDKVAVKAPTNTQPQAAVKPVYRVQLHALRSRASARREWRKIKKSHDDLFGQKQMTLLSGKNKISGAQFVRLQAGPFNGFRDARYLCSQARKRQLACVVVQQ